MPTATATSYLEALQRDGFVVIPSLLSPQEITPLRNAATQATTLTRQGNWPFFRTVPKQFPPWPKEVPPASEGGIWGVQHLLHPDMPGRDQFAKFYFDERVLSIVEELLGLKKETTTNTNTSTRTITTEKTTTGRGDVDKKAKEEDGEREDKESLVMELFNLLVAPESRDFELRWHRDDVPDTVSPEEELRLLQTKSPQGKQSHAQYNLALCPDASLIAVPGSHRRVRTETERNADPYDADMPGQHVVKLEPGDAVFYDSNILHRGVYKPKPAGGEETRLTLHGSIGLKELSRDVNDSNINGASNQKLRATAVLQHGVGMWINREDAALEVGQRAENMRRNLIAMGRGEDVGYSLRG
jgi:hypothetical protein